MNLEIQALLEHSYGLNFIVILLAIFFSFILNHNIKRVPVAIFSLAVSIIFFQIELIEHTHLEKEIALLYGYLGLAALSIAMQPIGLEIHEYSVFLKAKFWLIIFLIFGSSGILACFITIESFELIAGYTALLLTSSLAVLNVFIQIRPKILNTNLVKLAMPIGFTTDCGLWILISFLKINHEVGITFETILPQIVVLFGSILIVFLGKKWWWDLIPENHNIDIWIPIGGIFAFAFFVVGFSPVLGAIFGGLVVPNKVKHKLAHENNRFFGHAMLFYMATVGFKIHDIIDLQSFKIAFEIICLTTIVKFIGIKYSGLFTRNEILPALFILGNGGTMLIAAGVALASPLIDGTSILPHNTPVVVAIVAVIYTVAASFYFDKHPIEVNKTEIESKSH